MKLEKEFLVCKKAKAYIFVIILPSNEIEEEFPSYSLTKLWISNAPVAFYTLVTVNLSNRTSEQGGLS